MPLRAMASFEASFPADAEFAHPEGCHFARVLERHCHATGFGDVSFDNWRDCGWYVSCTAQASPVWVCFARYSGGEQWQLFVEHRGPTGLMGRLLGKSPPAASAVRALASLVEGALHKEASVSALRRSLSGDPRKSGVPSVAALPWPEDAAAGDQP